MDITAPDILGMLTAGVFIAALVVGPLVFYGIRTVLRKMKRKPPEHAGIFTEQEATRLIQLKYRYETTEEVNR